MRRIRSRLGRPATRLAAGLLATAATTLTLVATQPASAQIASNGHPAASAASAAGSIVYLKNGYVWIAHANGSDARQFTRHRFNWSSPSEANNGTVVVAGGRARTNKGGGSFSTGSSEIYRFRPDGSQIGSFIPTWGSFSTASCPTFGPVSVEVSPDATKVAYGIWECADPSYTALWTPASATKLDFPHQDVGQMNYYEPHWVSNTTFLVSHAGVTITDSQARWYTHGVGQADNTGYKGWNVSNMTGSGAQAIIDRSGDKLVVFEDDAADWTDGKARNVRLWLWTGHNIPSNWTQRCVVKLPAAQFSDSLYLHPSFSPDGKEVIWGDKRGIEEASVANPGSCSSIKPHLLISGGSQPFWSAGTEQRGARDPRQPG